MQLILYTVPVLREEDHHDLRQVIPSYVSHGWRVRRSFRELLPEVDADGERDGVEGEQRKTLQLRSDGTFILYLPETINSFC